MKKWGKIVSDMSKIYALNLKCIWQNLPINIYKYMGNRDAWRPTDRLYESWKGGYVSVTTIDVTVMFHQLFCQVISFEPTGADEYVREIVIDLSLRLFLISHFLRKPILWFLVIGCWFLFMHKIWSLQINVIQRMFCTVYSTLKDRSWISLFFHDHALLSLSDRLTMGKSRCSCLNQTFSCFKVVSILSVLTLC